MNSSQERALFEEYGWTYDHIARRWTNYNGLIYFSTDFIVRLTAEPEGDVALMRGIVQLGRPPTTIAEEDA